MVKTRSLKSINSKTYLDYISLNDAVHSTATKLKRYGSYSVISEGSGKNNSDYSIVVNYNTLNNLVFQPGEIKEVNWIKIDIEGDELEVLKCKQYSI
jgi:FkbM family methyltransferase